jgi:transposase
MLVSTMSRRADWKKRVAQWKKSGLTAEVFAAEHNLNARTLRWWSSALRRPDGRATKVGFARLVPVDAVPAPTAEPAPLEVVLASGRVVRVRSGFDPALLRAVLVALEAS